MRGAFVSAVRSGRRALRAEMRRRRRALSRAEQRSHAEALARHLIGAPEVRRSRRIAVYLVNDGEIDPAPLIERLWRTGREVYLPVLRPDVRLWFLRYEPKTRLAPNHFGIPEPARPAPGRVAPRALDLVLMPLVAYDPEGARIGMGGGYYDRTFAYLADARWARPALVGLAHRLQRLDSIEVRDWDVPLAAVATEMGIERFGPAATGNRTGRQ